MLTFYSEDTKKRQTRTELDGGRLVTPYECPERVDIVIGRVRDVGLDEVRAPDRFGLEPVLAVHDRRYVEFLESVWDDWVAAGLQGEVIPFIWPTRRMRAQTLDDAIDRIRAYAHELLVVSLGVDTFESDPISSFKLQSTDFIDYGARLKRLGLPTLFLLECGHAVAGIGVNAVHVLSGFEGD